MPIFSPPKLSKWLRLSSKWQRLLVLLLVGLLIHPLSSVHAQVPPLLNEATATYTEPRSGLDVEATSNRITTGLDEGLIDPGGQILGCDGLPLDSYAGFEMRLYEPDATGLDIGELVDLTDNTNGVRQIPPNLNNINPFPLSIDGRYNFLLDQTAPLRSPVNAGLLQTTPRDVNAGTPGARYILVINTPEDSEFQERRVGIEITAVAEVNGQSILQYRATSLDGQPISLDGSLFLDDVVVVDNAETQFLFFDIELDASICESNQINITKSADRSAAQPGDIVSYRLNVTNFAGVEVESVVALDTLPTGFELIPETVAGQINGSPIDVSAQLSGSTIAFSVVESVVADQTLDITYGVRLTPDAIRGSGSNSAIITANRTDSGFQIKDGPSIHRLTLDPGILADCGTLLGRVFEDKNFDGEQQSGEAGIPNAVIFLDDGNRVVTDADGLFSVQKMLPGRRTGTIDLASLPGYTLAPNLYFNERNSHSRLVNLAPGGLVRMNFGVTPTFQEDQE
ncbi:MAG: hypothetical protein AAF171_01445 [Cyanobacteria bacterium P01_A01_bin.116]